MPAASRTVPSATERLTTARATGPSSWWWTAVPRKPTVRPSRTSGGAGRRQLVALPGQVDQHQPARRPAQVLHPGDRLLPPVAALVQVHRGADPAHLVRDGPVVRLGAQPRPPRLHPQRLVRPGPGRGAAGGGEPLGDRRERGPRNQQVGGVRAGPGHPAHETAAVQRHHPVGRGPGPGGRRAASTAGVRGPTRDSTASSAVASRGSTRSRKRIESRYASRSPAVPGSTSSQVVPPVSARTKWCSTCPCGDSTSPSVPAAVGERRTGAGR